MRNLLAACGAILLASCAHGAGEPRPAAALPASVVAQPTLEGFQAQIDKEYIVPFVAGRADDWLEIFDVDAIGLHNRLPALEGKQGLRGFAEFVGANLIVAEMSVSLTGMRENGDLAYTWGTYRSRLIMRATGLPMAGHSEAGKVLFVWKRQDDGGWKIVADMGNDLPNAPNS